jgi:antitoxin component YwqK of YwqJK toxin-antitoxin module
MITTKNKFGLLHSLDDKPSIIDNGDLYWHKDGLLHRDNDLPSIIMNNGDKYWHINGEPSRSDISLPFIEKSNGYKEYNLENGGKRIISHLEKTWKNKDHCYHRDGGPAYTAYYENGNIKYEDYYLNGKIHKEDGPAYIEFFKSGKISFEEYRLNGKWHREDGPAKELVL